VRYETLPGKQLQADFWGGIPEQVLVDNAKALITLNNPRTGALVVNPTFAAFARHWGFTVKACWPVPPRQPWTYRGVMATSCGGAIAPSG
jgi:transposase